MENFQCNGTACGSRCCRDWRVGIDSVTYEKYCALEPEELRREICQWIGGQDEKMDYQVRLREDGRCPYLQDDLLCHIQREKGEGFLSDICYSYPRVLMPPKNLLVFFSFVFISRGQFLFLYRIAPRLSSALPVIPLTPGN